MTAADHDPRTCTCVVGICREDDGDGCCESHHCPAAGRDTDVEEPS